MLNEAEGSIGAFVKNAVDEYYKGRNVDTAQAIRRANTDTEAAEIIGAMRRGRWQDLVGVAGVCSLGVASGAMIQHFLNDPRVMRVSPVALLGLITSAIGLWAPVGVAGRAALVAGGLTYATSAQMYGWRVNQ